MNTTRFLRASIAIIGFILVLSGCAGFDRPRDTIFQVSTIDALSAGGYDGETTVEELLRHGDLGIGTFVGLDGEMLVIDGTAYRVSTDGVPGAVPPGTLTPFAVVTFFDDDLTAPVTGEITYPGLQEKTNGRLGGTRMFTAVRVHGTFDTITFRSVPKQEKPYPTLAEALKNQVVFTLNNVSGTLVGFVCPSYVGGVNVPGWHLHFISDDKTAGGHLLGFTSRDMTVSLDETDQFFMILPAAASPAIGGGGGKPAAGME